MAHAMAFCLNRVPSNIWWSLYNKVQTYGVPAVFGRDILYQYEMDAMNITANIINCFRSREGAKDIVAWSNSDSNQKAVKILNIAMQQFEKYEAEWQNVFK